MDDLFAQYARYIPLLIPIMLLELELMVFALLDPHKRETTRGPKWAWIPIIVLINLIGPIRYFVFGRREERHGSHSLRAVEQDLWRRAGPHAPCPRGVPVLLGDKDSTFRAPARIHSTNIASSRPRLRRVPAGKRGFPRSRRGGLC
jgi:hypothetical protein